MSNTGLQQTSAGSGPPGVGPATAGPPGGSGAPVGPGNGPKKARSGYNAKAMAEIRNSLRPYEDNTPPIGQLNLGNLAGMQTSVPIATTVGCGSMGGVAVSGSVLRPVSSLSTGSSSNSNYSDWQLQQSLAQMALNEVRIFLLFSTKNLMVCILHLTLTL